MVTEAYCSPVSRRVDNRLRICLHLLSIVRNRPGRHRGPSCPPFPPVSGIPAHSAFCSLSVLPRGRRVAVGVEWEGETPRRTGLGLSPQED